MCPTNPPMKRKSISIRFHGWWIGRKLLSVALCLTLLTVALPGASLRQCTGRQLSQQACQCRGACTCCHHAAHTGSLFVPMHSAAHKTGCAACIDDYRPVDRVGLLPFPSRGMHIDHGSAELVDESLSFAFQRGLFKARREPKLSQTSVFIMECSLLV